MSREFDGMDLFDNIQDAGLRNENRAKVMANVTELSSTSGGITDKGLAFLTGYYGLIPEDERAAVFTMYLDNLRFRGIDASVVARQAAY